MVFRPLFSGVVLIYYLFHLTAFFVSVCIKVAIPSVWKSSSLLPLYENVPRKFIQNYKSTVQLFESFVMKRLSPVLESAISVFQHVSVRGRSACNNFLEFFRPKDFPAANTLLLSLLSPVTLILRRLVFRKL